MGIFSWLFGKPEARIEPRLERFSVSVVGESHYQANLEAICGRRKPEGENVIMTATLVLEDSNPYDSNAVRVDIGGKPVGYLSRSKAKRHRKRLKEAGHPEIRMTQCEANIRGGWKRPGNDVGNYGVWLDLSAN